MKDKKFIYGSIIAVAFLLTVGLTYAYFSLTVSGNDVAQTINVGTTKLGLIYTDGDVVNEGSIEPGWTMRKTITVENTGNEETYYSLGWQRFYSEIENDELMIRCRCTSSGVDSGSCDSTSSIALPLTTSEVVAQKNEIVYPYKEAQKILPGETHTYTVMIRFVNYTDQAQNYNQGKKFYGVLGATESNKPQFFSDYIIDNYQNFGLTKIDQVATGNQNYDTTEYRYQGISPNNYITFIGEGNVWRIIGVFEVETPNRDGTYTKENKVKIVRNQLEQNTWNYSSLRDSKNDWTASTLMTMLNDGPYYNRTSGYTQLDCSTGYETTASDTALCNYESNGLTKAAKRQISSTKWYLGSVYYMESNRYGNAKNIYTQERSTNILNDNKQIWDGNIGLIYPSDYMYASSACYNDDTMFGFFVSGSTRDYSNEKCTSTNWLFSDSSYWTISPDLDSETDAMAITYNGAVFNAYIVDTTQGVTRPSLYLNADTIYLSGNGEISDPFMIK